MSVVNFIPSKFESCPQGVSKVVLDSRLNVYRERSGDSWFVFHAPIRFYTSVLSECVPNTNSKQRALLMD